MSGTMQISKKEPCRDTPERTNSKMLPPSLAGSFHFLIFCRRFHRSTVVASRSRMTVHHLPFPYQRRSDKAENRWYVAEGKQIIAGIARLNEARKERQDASARHLDAETGLAPVSALGVVSRRLSVLEIPSLPDPRHDHSGGESLLRRPAEALSSPSDRRFRGEFVPDGVTSSQTDPLGNGAVLLLGLGQLDLGAERLVALYDERRNQLAICSTASADSITRVRQRVFDHQNHPSLV